jgi:hypothetical protein
MKTKNYIVPLIFASPFLMAPLCSDSDFLILEQETAGLNDGGDGLTSENPEDEDTAYVVEEDKTIDTEFTKDDGGFHAIVQGTVTVSLYTLDQDGEYIYIDWDAYNGFYPFGSNFVAAYYAEDGKEIYVDQVSIASPDIDGDKFEFEIHEDDVSGIRIYAASDYWDDGIIGTADPIGNYPDVIYDPDTNDDYNIISGIDINILVPYWDGSSNYGGWGYGSGYGSDDGGGWGDYCNVGLLTGEVIITTSYAGGDASAMLLDTEGNGPYNSVWSVMEESGGGAVGPYSMTFCDNPSQMNLVGAYDSNYNGIIDPAGDTWGVYMVDGLNANPIELSVATLEADVQIPYGDYDGLDLTPFVRISGYVNTLVELPETTSIYVSALKYRPTSDVNVSDLVDGYDYEAFNPSEVQSDDLEYEMIVPANTVAYLWAYADVDNDGRINEAGEPVSSAGDDENGRVATGESSWTYDFDLNIVE